MFSSALKLACVAGAAAHVVTVRPRPSLPVLRAKATPSMNVANEVSTMLSNAGIEQVGPVLYSQLGVSGAMLAGGFGLNAFVDVPEPEEFETPEGETDIYRDSPLRYLGYANEVGEAFRPLVPVEIVYASYVLAITYILADTVDKGKQGAADGGGAIRGTLGALDTFCWQMLASVLFPSFIINRVVCLLASLGADGALPDLLAASWIPTVVGLALIPLIILPLDTLAHYTLNGSFRRASTTVKKGL